MRRRFSSSVAAVLERLEVAIEELRRSQFRTRIRLDERMATAALERARYFVAYGEPGPQLLEPEPIIALACRYRLDLNWLIQGQLKGA